MSENKKPIERINSEKTMQTFRRKLDEFMGLAKAGDGMTVKISGGNNKIGETPNISLPPIITCGENCKYCRRECYAVRCMIRSNGAAAAWCQNYLSYLRNPRNYFERITHAAYIYRFFRWHVSGDIVDYDYLAGMVSVAEARPECIFLAFTKQHKIVNSYCDNNGMTVDCIPENLVIIFSAAAGMPLVNPYYFPVAYINYADDEKNVLEGLTEEVKQYAYHCNGACIHCQAEHCGCWFLKRGKRSPDYMATHVDHDLLPAGAVYFDEH